MLRVALSILNVMQLLLGWCFSHIGVLHDGLVAVGMTTMCN